ncbi:TetR-like C-terminal domain-containing protein [Nocardia vaccinii]|uniref:TetR-like C-terminal domain-containing protein n=1 Tax=Nocardia vaccinii TaxID=1822 RepID=UPI00082A5455|nr:TetR-like C-terminal domain-containing protein [Nocardia vaccinii]
MVDAADRHGRCVGVQWRQDRALYRRWPSKVPLVEDAIFALDTGVTPAPTGDLRADLLAWTRLFYTAAGHPAARSAIPGLLSAYHDDHDSYRRLLDRGERPARRALRETVDAAIESGSASPGADVDALFEFLRGATVVGHSPEAKATPRSSVSRLPTPWSPWLPRPGREIGGRRRQESGCCLVPRRSCVDGVSGLTRSCALGPNPA